MTPQGYLIVFGPLVLCAVAIVWGGVTSQPWSGAVLWLGILGLVGWLVAAIWLASAMNTDI